MHIIGVIAEYDPFHKGHAYQLNQVLEHTWTDGILVIMSGHTTQRGSFPILDKWQRAALAVENGADLVCELPTCYSLQTAEIFAKGSVSLLKACGCDVISFGVETNEIHQLQRIANILVQEPDAYRKQLHQQLDQGLSYPAARQKALSENLCKDTAKILNCPNNILAVEYLKANLTMKANLKAIPVKRLGAGHKDPSMEHPYPSGSAIRKNILKRSVTTVLPYSEKIFNLNGIRNGHKNFEMLCLSRLMTATPESMRQLPDVTEGIEFAILNALKQYHSLEEIISAAASKRIPQSRIRRILMHLCLNYTQNDYEILSKAGKPHYLRVLACNQKGQQMIRQIQKSDRIPVLTNLHSNQTKLDDLGRQALRFDITATDLFYTLREETEQIHADYTRHPVIIS